MRKVKSCGVLILEGDPVRRFLLMEHADRLDLPKGHVDRGESDMECALRELVEETSITAQDIVLDEAFRFELGYQVRPKRLGYEACDKTLIIFLAYLKNPVEIVPTEHLGFRWVDWNPPHSIQLETIDPLLAHLDEYLRNSSR